MRARFIFLPQPDRSVRDVGNASEPAASPAARRRRMSSGDTRAARRARCAARRKSGRARPARQGSVRSMTTASRRADLDRRRDAFEIAALRRGASRFRHARADDDRRKFRQREIRRHRHRVVERERGRQILHLLAQDRERHLRPLGRAREDEHDVGRRDFRGERRRELTVPAIGRVRRSGRCAAAVVAADGAAGAAGSAAGVGRAARRACEAAELARLGDARIDRSRERRGRAAPSPSSSPSRATAFL